jgi:hypothetical protein
MKINEIILREYSDWDEELSEPDPRSRVVHETILDQVKIHCSEAVTALKQGRNVFKGFTNLDNDFYLTDPKLKTRKSQNTTNYYTTLMDNLLIWSKFPKRSQSLICTTSLRVAASFDEPFHVLPFNGARFGVCPESDLWYTNMTSAYSENKIFIDSLNSFYRFNNIIDDSYYKFIDYFMMNKDNLKFNDWDDISSLFKSIRKVKNREEVIKFFEKLYDPKRLGFKLSNIEKLPIESREVWTDSKAYLIRRGSVLISRLLNEN